MIFQALRFCPFIFLIFFVCTSLLSNPDNPPNGYHGESQNCAECHSGNLINSGDGSISLTGLPLTYVPGQTYDLSLTVSGTNSRGFGFQLSPKANGGTSGSITAVSGGMGIENGTAEHRGTSSSGFWNFQWTAPSTDEGTVTFYASGLATGGSSGNDGDYVYTFSENLSANSFAYASLEWNMSTGGVIFSSPTIGEDGSVYIGSNDNKLHAFNSDGSSKWSFETGNWVDSTPAIAPDGTIYVGSWDNKVYAINPDNGSKVWEYETNSYVIASPAIGADGKVYVGSKDSILYAFESNGSIVWEYFAGQPISSSAALGQDGTIYFGDENGTFHAVNPDGSLKWTYEVEEVADTNKSILSSPALDLSGNIYFGSGNGNCYSITDNGQSASMNWSFPTSDRVDASPVLGINDEVFFVSRDGYLRSLSTLTGNLNWDAFVGDVFYSSPVVDQNGRTYVIGYTGGGENHLFAFDSDGTKAWDTNDTECPFDIGGIVDASLALSSDGKLYYGCYNNRIYCINVGVPPADSDWPMFQRSIQRDGAWPSYLLETSVSPVGVASISGAGIYNEGATATITVSSITEGYSFSHWTDGASGSDNPLNIAINSSTSVTANFVVNQYLLTVIPGNGGNVNGNGTFNHGVNAPITATPETGYFFSGWTGEGIADATSASTTVSMTQIRTVTANFTPITYSISAVVSPAEVGEVSGEGDFQFGEDVTLTATATADGYSFLSWSGDINSSENPLTINIDSNLSLTANFSLEAYALSVFSETGGTAEGNGSFIHGTLATISATPDEGYSFAGWTGEGVTDPNAVSTTVEMTEIRNVSATFSRNHYLLTLLTGDGGTVVGEGNYSHGSEATIIASPEEGFSFAGWTGAGVENPDATITTVLMSQARIVTALFDKKNYSLHLTSNTGGNVIGEGNYSHGQLVTISALPESDFKFENWSGDIDGNLSSPSRTILMDANKSITATFAPVPVNQFVLTILSNPQTGGYSIGSGSYSSGATVPFTAEPFNGYEFLSWSGPEINDLNSSETQVVLNQDLTVTANFKKKMFLLEIIESDGGTTTGSGLYEYATDVNISALPNEGYNFSKWTGTGIANPGSSSTTISITEDLAINAVFAIQEYTLTLPVVNGGKILGSGTYDYGSVVNISAIPQPGYSFNSWNGTTLENPFESSTTITLTGDTNVTASFDRIVYSLSVNSNDGGTVSGSGKFYYGYNASLAAIASEGYSFIRWEGSGVANPSIPFTTIPINADRNVSAVFSINSYQLKILESDKGTTEGSGIYDYNTEVSISASAKAGYKFSHWIGDGITESDSESTTILLSGDLEIVPVFSAVTLANAFEDVSEIAPDWFGSPWFGTFFQNKSGWSYHLEFGWIYPTVLNSQDIWFWHNKLGWIWVNKDTFSDRYMWSDNTQNWLLWDRSENFEFRYFDYSISDWVLWD